MDEESAIEKVSGTEITSSESTDDEWPVLLVLDWAVKMKLKQQSG